MALFVTKRDGSKEAFNANKINESIERACKGLSDPIAKVTQIATETNLTLYSGITTEELDKATISAALQNVKDDPEYDRAAVRLLLKTVYRKVLGEYDKDDPNDLQLKHKEIFPKYIQDGIDNKKIDPRMKEKFNLDEISSALVAERDELFFYAGISSLVDRYMLKDEKDNPIEVPQYTFMRIAIGLSYNEKNPTA